MSDQVDFTLPSERNRRKNQVVNSGDTITVGDKTDPRLHGPTAATVYYKDANGGGTSGGGHNIHPTPIPFPATNPCIPGTDLSNPKLMHGMTSHPPGGIPMRGGGASPSQPRFHLGQAPPMHPPTNPTDLMVQMLLQKVQAHQQTMKLIMYQHYQPPPNPTQTSYHIKLNFTKWEKTVRFGIY